MSREEGMVGQERSGMMHRVVLVAVAVLLSIGVFAPAESLAGVSVDVNGRYEPNYNEPAPLENPSSRQLSRAPMSQGSAVFRATDAALAIAPKGVVIATGIATRKFNVVYQVDIIQKRRRILFSPTVEPAATGIYTDDRAPYGRPESRRLTELRKEIEESGLDIDDAIRIVREEVPDTSIYYVEFFLDNRRLFIGADVRDSGRNERFTYNVATGESTYTGDPANLPEFTTNELVMRAISLAEQVEPDGELVSLRLVSGSGSTFRGRISLRGGQLAKQLFLNAAGEDSFGAEVLRIGPALSVSSRNLHQRVSAPSSSLRQVFGRLEEFDASIDFESMSMRLSGSDLVVDATVVEEGVTRSATFDAMTGEEVVEDPTPEDAGADPASLAQAARVAMSFEPSARFLGVEEVQQGGQDLHVVRMIHRKGKRYITFVMNPEFGYAFDKSSQKIPKDEKKALKEFRKLLKKYPVDVHAAMNAAVAAVDGDRAYRVEVIDDGDGLLIAIDMRSEEDSHRVLIDAVTYEVISTGGTASPCVGPVDFCGPIPGLTAFAMGSAGGQPILIELVTGEVALIESLTPTPGIVQRSFILNDNLEVLDTFEERRAAPERVADAVMTQALLGDRRIDLTGELRRVRASGFSGELLRVELTVDSNRLVLVATIERGGDAFEVWLDLETGRVTSVR